jgi:hypothetical protein
LIRFFATDPHPLTRPQRLLLIWTAILVAVTRVYAASKSMWEWDEALFALAVRDYDISQHHPHPPGFPLFIGAAHAVRLLVGSDFRSLQTVTIAAAIALFPLLFFLAREFRFAFSTSYLAAVLFVFFPNVWFFGGTAFSDVPALALSFASALLFLRSVRQPRAFVLAAALLGMAVSVRPQNVILVLIPALLGTWATLRASWKRAVAGIAAAVSIVVLSYGGAALASESPALFMAIVRSQQKYVRDIDSVMNPGRPPLGDIAPEFITQPMRGGDRATTLAILALVGIVATVAGRNRVAGLVALLMFVPMMIFSWLMLDIAAVTRYTVSYVAGHALFAAHGAWWLGRAARKYATAVQAIFIGGLAVAYGTWAFPAIREVRLHDAPTAAVMKAVPHFVPADAPLYVHEGLRPFSSYFLEGRGARQMNLKYFDSGAGMPRDRNGAWVVVDSFIEAGDGSVFNRDDGRTWQIARRRYYVTSVVPLTDATEFGEGWYDGEPSGLRTLRWMGTRAEISLPPSTKSTLLMLDLAVPTPLIAKRPVVRLSLNGRPVAEFVCTRQYEQHEWLVDAKTDGPNELVLTTTEVINPLRAGVGADSRDLGLQLRSYVWRARR